MLLPLPVSLRRFAIRLNLALAFLAGAGLSPCLAQVTGNIVGQVRDQTKNGVPDVEIKVVNAGNGRRSGTKTNRNGGFVIFDLPPGSYYIIASKQNYRSICIPPTYIHLDRNNAVKYPPNIELGGKSGGQACQGLKIAAAEPKDDKTRPAVVERDGGQPQGYAVDEEALLAAPRGGPHAPSYDIVITLEREVDEAPAPDAIPQTQADSSQTAAQATSPSKTESEAIGVINTVDAVRSSNFTGQQIESLPLGAASFMRSFDDLALLVAGVAPPPYTPGARGPGVGFGIGTAGQFSVNGARARSNNFTVDGSDTNDPDVGVRRGGYVAQVPQSLESIQEVSISTLLWSAQMGRNLGSQVNAVSKYGGNEYHGQVYGFFNDSRLNARNFFDYTGGASGGKDPLTRTQAGLVIGGPVARDRTEFFGSLEGAKVNASTEQHFSTPRLAERNFLGSLPAYPQRGVSRGRLFGVKLADDQPEPFFFQGMTQLGGIILCSEAAQKNCFYPLPNNPIGPFGANTFTQILPAGGGGMAASFRVTHRVSTDHSLDARYNFTDDDRILPSVNRAMRSTIESRTRSQNLSLILGSALGARLFNQARFSFGRTRLDFPEYPGSPFIFSGKIDQGVARPSRTGPIGELIVEPFSPIGVGVFSFPQRRASNTFQYADSVSWALGDHSLKFGGAIRRYQLNSVLDRLYRPRVVYQGGRSISGVELASLGVASSVLQTITLGAPDSTIGLRFTEHQFLVNDHWRIRPNFSFDFGLRYEYNTVPREVNNRIEKALRLENLPAPGDSRFSTTARTDKFNAVVDAYRRVLDGRTSIYEPDRNNFGPRAGFAWAPGAGGRTAIRAGFGVYYDAILGAVVSQSRNAFPNEIPINVDHKFLGFNVFDLNNPLFLAIDKDSAGRPTTLVRLLGAGVCNRSGACNQFGGAPEDFAALIGQALIQNQNGGLAFTIADKNLRTPYAQQWHLTVEREVFGDFLLSAAYVGTKGTKLTRLTTPNLGPDVTPAIPIESHGSSKIPLVISENVTGGFVFSTSGIAAGDVTHPYIVAPRRGGVTRTTYAFGSRPDPALGPYQIFENSANSSYHALQLEARKRYHRGYQFTAAYTWSHAIDYVSDLFPIAGAPVLPQDSFNLRGERASASYDIRQRLAASFVWDLPFYRNSRGVKSRLFGGWQTASIFQLQTGQPFTLNLLFDNNLDGNMTDRPGTTNGLVFLDRHGPHRVALAASNEEPFDYSGGCPEGSHLITSFDRCAIGRNTARGDGFINLDLALTKTFQFSERQKLGFRAEFFNLFNRANFGHPIRVIGAPGFGSAVDTANPARMVQFALKYSF